jgi:hypothetical protein
MVTVVLEVTAEVVPVTEPLVLPAAMVTVVGRLTSTELAERSTDTPPLGAGDVRVTVAVNDDPPITLVGLTLTEATPSCRTVNEAEALVLSHEAAMVTAVSEFTAVVLMVTVVPPPPSGMVTVFGTVAHEALLARATTVPPLGAGPVNMIVALAGTPPVTWPGSIVNFLIVGGVTVSLTFAVP